MNFVQKVLDGKASASQIDDYVDQWHEGNSDQSLADFLGFTKTEYELWVKRPEALDSIIMAHRKVDGIEPVEHLAESRPARPR